MLFIIAVNLPAQQPCSFFGASTLMEQEVDSLVIAPPKYLGHFTCRYIKSASTSMPISSYHTCKWEDLPVDLIMAAV